ncbi:acyl-CoA dehydrogenase family protein [Streptosporangium amethystogenes]|uniref:acyl-CoA dehydrogenase family protein n=1 Tax=Streptosporangium amethystogenes TaxID=2002 RepID=UPI0037B22F6C
MTDWQLLAPDEDTLALADTARAQFRSLHGPAVMRATLDGGVPDGWETVADGGYADIGIPEDLGGIGRVIDLVVMLEEAGRALLTAPLLASALAFRTQVGAGVHREDFRRAPAGFGIAEGIVDESGRCHVERAHVLGGPGAAAFTLIVKGPDRAWIVVVDPEAEGVEPIGQGTLIDPSRPLPAFRLGGEAGVACAECRELPLGDLDRVLAGARVCVAADLAGTAAGALDAAVGHVLQRRQFGRAIGTFQAVKHQLADAYTAVERARSLAYGAALSLAGGPPGDAATRDCLLANAVAAETAVRVASLFTQLMGAMGVTFEADCHLFLRRAHQTACLLGEPDDLYLAAARIERRISR